MYSFVSVWCTFIALMFKTTIHSKINDVSRCLQSRGVLKDVLMANKRAREEFLKLLTSTQEYLQPFPEKCKELIEEACPGYENTLDTISRSLAKKDDCKLLIAGIMT